MKRPRIAAAAATLALLAAGCGTGQYEIRRSLEEYLHAVQGADPAKLAPYSAEYADLARAAQQGAAAPALETFTRLTELRLAAYEAAKVSGTLELGPDGIGLIKGLGMGRGVFYQIRDTEIAGERASLRLEVNLGYGFHPFESYPEGTTIYLMGMPVGRFLGPVRGTEAGKKLDVLGGLELVCALERDPDAGHPTGWRVRSLESVPGSERPDQVTWR